MFVQIRLERKRLPTFVASERLAVGVSLDVGAQVGLVCKGLGADVAAKGALTWKIV